MSENDMEFNEWKESTRQDALNKEIERLRLQNKNQSHKLQNLRKVLYFQLFFVVSLFIILFVKGFINLPTDHSSDQEQSNTITLLKDSIKSIQLNSYTIKEDTIYLMGTPDSILNSEIVFSVQIGAFLGKDLSMFNSNFTKHIRQDTYDAINQISVGLFTKYNHAAAFLTLIQDLGFTDAFIMALKNGRRTDLQKIISSLPPDERIPIRVSQPTIPIKQSEPIKDTTTLNSIGDQNNHNDSTVIK